MLGRIAGFVVAALSVARPTFAQGPTEAQSQAAATLRALYPGVRVDSTGPHGTYVRGGRMTPGLTEEQAAADFLRDHGAVFGGPLQNGQLETTRLWALPSMDGKFVAFAYRQKIRGKEVEGSDIRIKVQRAPFPHVDYAAARLAGEPTVGAETPLLTPEAAQVVVRAFSGIDGLAFVGTPDIGVLRGDDHRSDAWCYRVSTRQETGLLARFRTYYVDSGMPRILRVSDHSSGVQPATTGVVVAQGTPAVYPFTPYMGPSTSLVWHPLPGVRVRGAIQGVSPPITGSTYAGPVGNYSLDLGSAGQSVLVSATLEDAGTWYQVFHTAAPLEFLSASAIVSVGASQNLALFNASGNPLFTEELMVAQADTVFSANRGRKFFLSYISDTAPGLSLPLNIVPSYPTSTGQCGSTFVDSVGYIIAFEDKNPVRWSCGCHSIVGHEYGHVALSMIGFPRATYPGFDEGYADTFSYMLNDDSVMGRLLNRDGTNLRDDPTSGSVNCQYPIPDHLTLNCDCGSHKAGQLLSGPWVRIVRGFKVLYGNDAKGLEAARDLFGRWTLVTIGGDDSACHSAFLKTVDEIVQIAKPDQIPTICDAFAQHNIFGSECAP